jgi:PhzF family phenazine biosynthesis protein
MRAIAAEVGYSGTAFVTSQANDTFAVRYFSPESEVPFCGHATIATATRERLADLDCDFARLRDRPRLGNDCTRLPPRPHV